MASHAHAAHATFDETDPHGGTPHTHVIVPPITMRLVLGALLFFTALTVGTALLEVWVMDYFNIHLPAWVNVTGAMIIATIKAVLVMAYFMQLRYDNPMNTIIMLFCFFAVGLFLLFTSLDLFTRDRVYDYKGTYVIQGGTYGTDRPMTAVRKETYIKTLGAAIVGESASEEAKVEAGTKRYKEIKEVLYHGKHAHGADVAAGNSAQVSRPASGLSGALGSGQVSPAGHAAPKDASHSGGH